MAPDAQGLLAEFAAGLGFVLDPFQHRACEALLDGRGVLVAAPTGSGKTVVGEFAAHLALATGGKCFYTTPIKALSNQKHADLVRRYGAGRVGLLTGDNSVNADAPVVVMTTEVLRNMLYSRSPTLAGLRFAVMDEVHYLADRSRGAVWEEVIIHLPESVAVASLSATVSNAEEFGDWLRTVRGEVEVIVEERRPVPLYQHVMAGPRLYDLFASDSGPAGEQPVVNPALVRIARDDWARGRIRDHRGGRGSPRRPGGRTLVPGRVDVVQRLKSDGLLPAIMFIFSRAGCDAAVQQLLDRHAQLTSADEEREILAYARGQVTGIPTADLEALGFRSWLTALGRGVASHHAGLLPVFKECVEQLFSRGLVKVVFATETLALGINMPARCVVIDRLTKWNGETHADVTPGEYTQLTGRAGRRGIDVEGHAVVLWAAGLDPSALAGLASTRTYPLRSSFRASYNMAVNLVRTVGSDAARELLASSFAQFQADRAVVGLAADLRRSEEALAGYAEAMACDRGDFAEYAGLRRELGEREQAQSRLRRSDQRHTPAARREREAIDRLRAELRAHPCHQCPEREQHARWAERHRRLDREVTRLRARIDHRSGSIPRQFDTVCDVLRELGYLDGEDVTPAGSVLARIYGDLDLLAAECLRRGLWSGLEAPALAAAMSALVFESRRPDGGPHPKLPGGAARRALEQTAQVWTELHRLEREHGMDSLRPPDVRFAWAAYRWAGGSDLDDVLDDVDLAAGDFVRAAKQLVDMAGQVAAATDDPAVRRAARQALDAIRRGVVSYGADED